jgi:hypothetical protein
MASELLFTCPTTYQRIPTGIKTDLDCLRGSWAAKLKVNCPLCGKAHEVSVRETYVDNSVADDVLGR